jgi:hypothetical protein
MQKQLVLKPQDLLVTVKVAVNRNREFLLQELATELFLPLSTLHGSIGRAEEARLLSRSSGSIRAIRPSLKDFMVYGARYAYPGNLGPPAKGIPTAIAGPSLAIHFNKVDLPPVWPTPTGEVWGAGLLPIHPSVPRAAGIDAALYEALSLLDAIRIGAARERELAIAQLETSLLA